MSRRGMNTGSFLILNDLARLSRNQNEKGNITTKGPARQGRNRNSEYLAQRRQGRKGRRITVNNFSKIIHLSPPNLAYFAPWRESIPLFEYFSSTENLRRPREFSRIVVEPFSLRSLRLPVSKSSLLLNPRIPQNRIAAQARTEKVDLELRRATRAKIFVVFSDVRLTRRKRRHELFQVYRAMQRVELVVLLRLAEHVAAATAADHTLFPVTANFERKVKAKERAPAVG